MKKDDVLEKFFENEIERHDAKWGPERQAFDLWRLGTQVYPLVPEHGVPPYLKSMPPITIDMVFSAWRYRAKIATEQCKAYDTEVQQLRRQVNALKDAVNFTIENLYKAGDEKYRKVLKLTLETHLADLEKKDDPAH